KFRASLSVLFALLEYALPVSLLGAQEVKYNACQFVSSGCDRLWLAQSSGDGSEELAEGVFGMMKRIGPHSHGERKPAFHRAATGEQDLAAADLPFWA